MMVVLCSRIVFKANQASTVCQCSKMEEKWTERERERIAIESQWESERETIVLEQ